MPNSSYLKGYRFEKRTQAWLTHLGPCTRSMMSRGADLILLWSFRHWTISCKCGKKGKVTMKTLRDELEAHDIISFGEDREVPIVAMYLPKFVEFCGKVDDKDLLFNEDSAA